MNASAPKRELSFGFSSPATQCEGGELESTWVYHWGLGYIADRAAPAVAAQHRAHWQEDTALLASLGVRVHRMGVDWTRVEPLEGEFDEEALADYRAELTALQKAGIAVQLELHHFTNPVWFEELGGFAREENLTYFLRYAETVVGALGALCSEYITFAEPNAYAFGGWLGGSYPPCKNNPSRLYTVLTNMAVCHAETYRLIHSYREAMGWGKSRVSVSLRAHDFVPRGTSLLTQRACELTQRSFFSAPLHAFYTGHSMLPMKHHRLLSPGRYADFLAVDWHGRAEVASPRDALPCHTDPQPAALGALIPFLASLHTQLSLPISVTLRGAEDTERRAYLQKALRLLRSTALPVERCFYLGFTDGFEWLLGQSSRRGIVHVDFETQKRALKEDLSELLSPSSPI